MEQGEEEEVEWQEHERDQKDDGENKLQQSLKQVLERVDLEDFVQGLEHGHQFLLGHHSTGEFSGHYFYFACVSLAEDPSPQL